MNPIDHPHGGGEGRAPIGRKNPPQPLGVILHLEEEVEKGINIVIILLSIDVASTIIHTIICHTIATIMDLPIYIIDRMVGHKLGEFAQTLNFQGYKNDNKSQKKENFDFLRLYQWRLKEEYQSWKPDEITIKGQYLSMSVDKGRRLIDHIRGRSYEETLVILELMPYRACYPIFKLIYSAAANVRHNRRFKKANLTISKAKVNKESLVPHDVLVFLRAIPKGRLIELLSGRYLEKYKLRTYFYHLCLI
ncbi:50S ribosomal protein L22 chloroplastic [Bienertia sinuspersici]